MERSERTLSIVVIDRRVLTRECLAHRLASRRGFHVRSAATAAEIAEGNGRIDDADLILLCIGAARVTSPGVASDVDRLVRDCPNVPLVLLADHEDIEDLAQAILRGVRGYIPTSLDLTEAAGALRFIGAGGTFVPASTVVMLLQSLQRELQPHVSLPAETQLFDRLTPRELEVLERLRQGKPNKIIARELQISESTVKVFVCRILTKLRATNRTEVAYLMQARAPLGAGAQIDRVDDAGSMAPFESLVRRRFR